MKTNILKKGKYYIISAIAILLIISIGLSFCAWDSNSLKNISMQRGVANYEPNYKLVDDKNNDKVASVGDIVTFGNYYQSSTNDNKTPLRWIVVHVQNGELTLLAESVVACGSFYGRYYMSNTTPLGEWVEESNSAPISYANYNESTVSQWLNSDYSARYDGGTAFSANASKLGMRGFLKEAFSPTEQKIIIDKTISGIQGYAKGSETEIVTYKSATSKVWLPSWSEIFGDATIQVIEDFPWEGEKVLDGTPNTRFDYFSDVVPAKSQDMHEPNSKLVAYTTPFATTPVKSNYTVASDTSHNANALRLGLGEVGKSVWMLRSPISNTQFSTLVLDTGSTVHIWTYYSNRGVRPAITIPA